MAKFVTPEEVERFFKERAAATRSLQSSSTPSEVVLANRQLTHKVIEDAIAELQEDLRAGKITSECFIARIAQLADLHPKNRAILAKVRDRLTGE